MAPLYWDKWNTATFTGNTHEPVSSTSSGVYEIRSDQLIKGSGFKEFEPFKPKPIKPRSKKRDDWIKKNMVQNTEQGVVYE